MNIITSTMFFVASLASSFQPALAASCSQSLAQFDKSIQRDDCVCDKSLSNLQATLPKQMKLVAACGLLWNDGRKVNLSMQKVSLDKYTNDYIWHGEIFITGTAKLSGSFHYEVGETETAWFSPVLPLIDESQHGQLADELRSLTFDIDNNIFERFHVPPFISNSESYSSCFTANATIEIDGIRLSISEGDDKGTFPDKFKVVSIGGFKPCAKK